MTGLLAGEGVVDITPPLGIEMGGFHRPPGKERRIKSIRQPAAVRALVVQFGETQVAICSLDVAAVGQEMAVRVRNEVARQTGIPASNVRVCATHTHSMPGFCFLRQWGAIPKEFMAVVEQRTVEAVRQAKDDLGAAEVALGKCRVTGGNHNRTSKICKTDERFTQNSTDDDRWLDTTLHALLFRRAGKRTLLWYHFSRPRGLLRRRGGRARLAGHGRRPRLEKREAGAIVPPGALRRRKSRRRERLAGRGPPDRPSDLSCPAKGHRLRRPGSGRSPAYASRGVSCAT